MKISATGCCLIDYVYTDISYDSPGFQRFLSRSPGDGGIIQGGLVFTEDLARRFGRELSALLGEILGSAKPATINLGGPAIIALINAAQLLYGREVHCRFYGAMGDDQAGQRIHGFLKPLALESSFKQERLTPSPSTIVLSDPSCNRGNGERSFLHTLGAASRMLPQDLPLEFFKSDLVLFGGTALTPALHDGLSDLLVQAKARGAITIVGTVYDFRNEKKDPGSPWPLGRPDACGSIDLLVADAVEALRLTGTRDLVSAARSFIHRGVGALVITNGEGDLLAWSGGKLFEARELGCFPVSPGVRSILRKDPSRLADTTGCGDNFLGGLVASLAMQLGGPSLSLEEALAWGAASGGFSCFYAGGLYQEAEAGEKLGKIRPLALAYLADLRQAKGGGS